MIDSSQSKSESLDLAATMMLMDAVDISRRQVQAAQEQLNFDDQKNLLIEKLRQTYQQMGVQVTDSQIENAVKAHFSSQWTFKPAEQGVTTSLLEMYVDRASIMRERVVPGIMYLSIAGAATLSVILVNTAIRIGQENGAETSIEKAYSRRLEISDKLSKISSSPYALKLPHDEVLDLKNRITSANARLILTNDFFRKYCPDGKSDKAVTQDNYQDGRKELESAIKTLDSAQSELEAADAITKKQEGLLSIEKKLETLIVQLNNQDFSGFSQDLKTKGDGLYNAAVASVKNRQLDEAEKNASELAVLIHDVKDLKSLTEKSAELYNKMNLIVAEQNAREKVDDLYRKSQSYISSGSGSDLKTQIDERKKINDEMKSLSELLSQEYKIVVFAAPGMRTGTKRKHDMSGEINYYLVVQAIDRNGRAIKMNIVNEENSSQGAKSVDFWGERVSKDVYERVIADKNDNGHIDQSNVQGTMHENRYFGVKKLGHLDVKIMLTDNYGSPVNRQGQLTDFKRAK